MNLNEEVKESSIYQIQIYMPERLSTYAKSKNSFEELVMHRSSGGSSFKRNNSIPRESEMPFRSHASSIDNSLFLIEVDIFLFTAEMLYESIR
jgi:hypothetical protein